MPPLTTKQRQDLNQIIQVTGLAEKTATKLFKAAGYNRDQTIEKHNLKASENAPQMVQHPDSIVSRSVTQYSQEYSVNYKPLESVETPAEFADPVRVCQVSGESAVGSGGIEFVRSRAPSPYPDSLPEALVVPRSPGPELPVASGLPATDCLTMRETIYPPFVKPGDTSEQPYFAPNFLETLFDSPPNGSFEPLQTDDGTDGPHSYYASTGGASVSQSKDKDFLSKLFEKYRDPKTDEVDAVNVNGTMRYINDLGLNMENAEVLVLMEIVQAPAMGEMIKECFVDGWKAIGADTISKQKTYVASQIKILKTDMVLFKRVYRHTFVCSKEKGQKALDKDTALIYWQMLFTAPGKVWATGTTNWIDLWCEFLTTKWTKSINKDMWNQTFEFFMKSMQDETLGFWSEDGAWPGVIDDFVAYAKEKRGLRETMETD